MGISIREFQVAMETFGAKRISDGVGSRYRIPVPCFVVADFVFRHSGSYYIVHNISSTIIEKAMFELNEKHPGGNNFWYGEIHSVKGLLTVACMIEKRYTKEVLETLVNETYKKLLESELIRGVAKTSCKTYDFSVMKESKVMLMSELCRLLDEFDNIVNPFVNAEFSVKEPSSYIDRVGIEVVQNHPSARLCLYTNSFELRYVLNGSCVAWSYSAVDNIGQPGGFTLINHYYDNNPMNENHNNEEIVYLRYTTSDDYEELPNDIDLRISLKTGMAWTTLHEEKSKLATQKEIKLMIRHLKKMIKKAKNDIGNYMIEKNPD